jgi:hypothetical protein
MDTPRISSVKWSPDGTFLISADKLEGATIICTNSNEPISTSEQFFASEISEGANDQTGIADLSREPLGPQPIRQTLSNIRFAVDVERRSFEGEQKVLETWR